jgi:DNA-directed RNA polymerase alpha subunit
MIEAGADIEIMNPDLVICTLDKGAKLNMEMTVNNGKGYRPARITARKKRLSALSRLTACSHLFVKSLRSGRHPRWPDH